MRLEDKVDIIPLVGPRYKYLLSKLGIETVRDLLLHIPHRWQDYTLFSDIATAQEGETITIQGQILTIQNIYTKYGKQIQKALVSDGENKIEVVWFNQPFLTSTLPAGTFVTLSGKVKMYGGNKSLVSPEYEKYKGPAGIHTGRLVPVYPETEGVTSKWLRSRIAAALSLVKDLEEVLPETILQKYNLMPFPDAVRQVHFPQTLKQAEEAKRRLAFDELLYYSLQSLFRKKNWQETRKAYPLACTQEQVIKFINSLPFSLTPSQKRSMKEILSDLSKDVPMNRLLQGEVGSGKTVVAAFACYISFCAGYQAVIMAPTQILAQQHFKTLRTILEPLGAKVELKISGTKTSKGKNFAGDVVIGTHALIQKDVIFEKLGLAVIDEQHRFGVAQRAKLWQPDKQGKTPHMLTMTATPIPRTITLALYGDLAVSTLDEMPLGRIPVKTWVVPPQKREAAYNWIRERVKGTDEQAFIVCPLIDESEHETLKKIRAAKAEFKRLSEKVFPDLKLRLLHGKTPASEKEKIMAEMRQGKVDILVSTPVVEVGVDIPNATIMMIEGAERFGLAQLHQLRGRVGRRGRQSWCLLFSESASPKALKRLKALEKSTSGRELAQMDLEMRGPGEVFGTAQHGFPEMKIANLADATLVRQAREAAEYLLENLNTFAKFKKFISSQHIAPN